MLVEVKNVRQQEKNRCTYCHGTGMSIFLFNYLAHKQRPCFLYSTSFAYLNLIPYHRIPAMCPLLCQQNVVGHQTLFTFYNWTLFQLFRSWEGMVSNLCLFSQYSFWCFLEDSAEKQPNGLSYLRTQSILIHACRWFPGDVPNMLVHGNGNGKWAWPTYRSLWLMLGNLTGACLLCYFLFLSSCCFLWLW